MLGIVLSVPIGPLGAYMVAKMEREGFGTAIFIGLITAIFDTLFCAVSLFGITTISANPQLYLIIKSVGLIILLYMGIRHFFLYKERIFDVELITNVIKNKKIGKYLPHLKDTFFVIVYVVSNPTLLAFWINMASLLHESILKNKNEYVLFSIGIGLGSLLCQYSFLSFVQKVHSISKKSQLYIRLVGIAAFAVTIIYYGIQIGNELFTNII
jgi:arginine exporter protein ArgO